MKTGHVGLNVKNLETSISFYTDVFGLEVISKSLEDGKKFAFLGHNGDITITLWEQSQNEFSKNQSGLHHLAFETDSLDSVKQLESKLIEMGTKMIYRGVTLHEEGAGSGGIFFLDPDGIRLEIYTASVEHSDHSSNSEGPACGFF
ncbi:VOC family protein [Alkalihalobacillus trypoxylicola]|uniref:Glyoxalase n=1 Tax=Alkalihalobacillus trypoxylicola TaxID=519424 RepID=A0A162DT75_9BACI|nr:VOC family protein [Alkalihalobacillus trypoxylicola]KYG30770.1 glyoxalase [Alkalihalobacillus trypoxylicola]